MQVVGNQVFEDETRMTRHTCQRTHHSDDWWRKVVMHA